MLQVLFSTFSAAQKVTERTLSEDTSVLEVTSFSSSPYVLPGQTPTALKDLTVHVLEVTI